MRRSCWVAAVVVWASACAGTRPHASLEVDAWFRSREARKAQRLAPDFYAAAEKARMDAVRARERGDRAALLDHSTRTHLLLHAAIVESQRVEYEERALAAHAAARTLEAQAVRDDQARVDIERSVARSRAVQIARDEVERSLALVAAKQRGHANLPTGETAWRAAAVLTDRARLVLAAATSLRAAPEKIRVAREAIDVAMKNRHAPTALPDADRALQKAQTALSAARDPSQLATVEEIDRGFSDARSRGLNVEMTERGLTLLLGSLFRARTAELVPSARQALERAAAVIRVQKKGGVIIELPAVPSLLAGASSLDERRGKELVSKLSSLGVSRDRLSVVSMNLSGDAEDVALVLPAYARGPR